MKAFRGRADEVETYEYDGNRKGRLEPALREELCRLV